MKVTYDGEADAAYVTLVDNVREGEAVEQSDFIELREGAQAVIDFDAEGHMLGIEILQASRVLRPDLLSSAPAPAAPT